MISVNMMTNPSCRFIMGWTKEVFEDLVVAHQTRKVYKTITII